MLGILGLSVIVETVRRAVVGSAPEGTVMLAVATLALMVNATVLRMLPVTVQGRCICVPRGSSHALMLAPTLR